MKNKYRLNILPPLIAAMFILSMFSGLVAAQTPSEQYEKQYRVYKDRYDNTRKQFEEVKEQFERANAKLKNAGDAASKDELRLRAKEYIEGAINHTIAQLEVLKSRVNLSENKGAIQDDAIKNIDAQIAQLEQLRAKVESATTIQELRDDHKELKDIWVNIRLETRYYFELILNHRIDNLVSKASNDIPKRLDAAIDNRKAKGKDVTELQKDEERYKALVDDAKASQAQTASLLGSHNGFNGDGSVTDSKAATEFIRQVDKSQRETIQKLKLASKQMINFVRDFRKLSGGKVKVSSNGDLEANDGNTEVTATATATTVTATSTPEVTVTATSTVTLTATPTTALTAAPGS